MTFTIECTVSGTSQEFTGTLDEAIDLARSSIRQYGWHQSIWVGGRLVAEVWESSQWISADPWVNDMRGGKT